MTKLKTPYAELLPPLSTEELEALKADLKDNGQRVPIDVDEDGNVLDGHHRYKILKADVKTRIVRGLSEDEKLCYAIRANVARRQMTPNQRAELDRKWRKPLAKRLREAGKTQREVAALLGVTQQAVSLWLNIPGTSACKRHTLNVSVKVPPKQHKVVAKRVKEGETQKQVAADYGVTQAQVSRIVTKEKKRVRQEAAVHSTKPLDKGAVCGLILADPPWRYEYCRSQTRQIENQYPTMTLKELCDMAKLVQARLLPDAVLFLWATAPKLAEALELMTAWGFIYRSCAVWDKKVIGMGYWFRQQHELLLVGVRGSPKAPAVAKRVSSVFRSKRAKHSKKPQAVCEFIEAAFARVPKLEMFQRGEPRKGWVTWGAESNG